MGRLPAQFTIPRLPAASGGQGGARRTAEGGCPQPVHRLAIGMTEIVAYRIVVECFAEAVAMPGGVGSFVGPSALLRPEPRYHRRWHPPLRKSRRVGQPQGEWCTQRSLKVGAAQSLTHYRFGVEVVSRDDDIRSRPSSALTGSNFTPECSVNRARK